MHRRPVFSLVLAAAVALALSGCSSPLKTATAATFNGVTAVDTATGTANMSVSALDRSGNVLGTGILSAPSASVTLVKDGGGATVTPAINGTATICANITGGSGDITGILTLDATGSMSLSDPGHLRADAAKAFVDRMNGGDRVAVASFDTSTTPSAPYLAIKVQQDLTGDTAKLDAAIDAATFDGGSTNLWDAGIDSATFLKASSGSNKVAVLLTDGVDNSSTSSPADVAAAAKAAGVKVYAVGLGSSLDMQDLIDVAGQTGGAFAMASSATDLGSLFDGMFNASLAAGCVRVQFDPAPPSGYTVAGTLGFEVDGHPVQADYQVVFP